MKKFLILVIASAAITIAQMNWPKLSELIPFFMLGIWLAGGEEE